MVLLWMMMMVARADSLTHARQQNVGKWVGGALCVHSNGNSIEPKFRTGSTANRSLINAQRTLEFDTMGIWLTARLLKYG